MSVTQTPQGILSLTRQNFRKLGLTVHAVVTDELDKVDQTLERAGDLGSTSSLAAAVFDALYEGKPPTGTKVMQEALLVQLKEMNIKGRLAEEANRRRLDVLHKHAPLLVAELAPVIEEADAAFTNARETIPSLNLDPAIAAGLPADQMEAWGRARDALTRVELVVATWSYLVPCERRHHPLIVADLDLDELPRIGLRTLGTDLALSGHRLSLANVDEYRARVERVESAQAERDAMSAEEAEHYARTGRPKGAPVAVLKNAWARRG